MSVRGSRPNNSKHAEHSRTCVCGQTCHGNGGWSSHRNACRPWKEAQLRSLVDIVARIDAGTWGTRSSPSLVAGFRATYTADIARLTAELHPPVDPEEPQA